MIATIGDEPIVAQRPVRLFPTNLPRHCARAIDFRKLICPGTHAVGPPEITMNCKSKWLDDASPSQAVSEVAATALRNRLRTVAHFLPLAAEKSDEDIENVHQLRVATRRAMAAIEMFEPFLSTRRAAKMMKWLKKIRRAGGNARDSDVLAIRIETLAVQDEDAPWNDLRDWVHQRRKKAQTPLREIGEKIRPKKFDRKIESLLQSVHDCPEQDESDHRKNGSSDARFGTFARVQLQQVLDKFFDVATRDFSAIETLHAFRIEGKHLRYSMELLATAFEASFRKDLYSVVERLQQRLGEINDHANAVQTFESLRKETSRKRLRKHLQRMADEERTALSQSRSEFTLWWTPERAAMLRSRFQGALDHMVSARK